MKPSELHDMSTEDLNTKLQEARTELFNLRFQMATSQLDNTARVKVVKKDVARISTELREREIEAEKKAAKAS
ncbi:MAG: 50S ribosomal protein L29 [Coriobacteriaceae bacterium]|nr:50S ribosomal protein L29 [Coriobacteriaceae bacterium]